MNRAANNIFELIPEKIKDEPFEKVVTGEHLRIERIISEGHASSESGWYDQAEHK